MQNLQWNFIIRTITLFTTVSSTSPSIEVISKGATGVYRFKG